MQINEKVKTGLIFAVILAVFLAMNFSILWWLLYIIACVVGFLEADKLFKSESKIAFLILGLVFASLTQMPVMSMIFAVMIYAGYSAYKKEKLSNILPLIYAGIGISFIYEVYVVYNLAGFIWLLLSVVLCDTFAYFVGKKYGKTKFCETSPNKTLEGVMGGVIIGGFMSFIYAAFAFNELGLIATFFISFAMAFFAVFGDLFESYLKRLADVKDSGELFPGHGGVLDRVDALIFGAITMVLLV